METFIKFFKGFYYAAHGFKTGLSQRNLKIHLFITFLVVFFGSILGLSTAEWLIVTLCIAMVISAELFNSAHEETCNLLNAKLKLDYYDTWNSRNLAAAAVLVVAIATAVIGLVIFVPKIILLFPSTTIR